MIMNQLKGAFVDHAYINALTWNETLTTIARWARGHESRYVCICNVHSIVSARQDTEFARVVREADMATPDGAPVAWMLRRLGFQGQSRINGPDLMWRYCELAEREGAAVYFYGSTEKTLTTLRAALLRSFPRLKIAGMTSPPFRKLTDQEDEATVRTLNDSDAGVIFVSLGCPKQEKWMAAHRGQVKAVTIGVGAAFDYHSGQVNRAPNWMQHAGLEWLHRLYSEPRRLWRRYLVTNTIFVAVAARQLLARGGK